MVHTVYHTGGSVINIMVDSGYHLELPDLVCVYIFLSQFCSNHVKKPPKNYLTRMSKYTLIGIKSRYGFECNTLTFRLRKAVSTCLAAEWVFGSLLPFQVQSHAGVIPTIVLVLTPDGSNPSRK